MSDDEFTEQDISDAFRRIAPPDRTPGGVVEGALRRRRRIRLATTAAVAVVAVVAAVVTPVALRWGQGQSVVLATPSPTVESRSPDGPPVATPSPSGRSEGVADPNASLVPEVCRDLVSGSLKPEDLPWSVTLPTGASRAWLCSSTDELGDGVGPREPLTADPDRAAAAINALPAFDGSGREGCETEFGHVRVLVVEYPNQPLRAVAIETEGCEFVGGPRQRGGGAGLVDTLTGLWERQRVGAPAFAGTPDLCQTHPGRAATQRETGYMTFMPVRIRSVVRGAACGLPADSTTQDWTQRIQRWLPDDLVAELAKALPDERAAYWGNWSPPGLPYFVLLNRFGDPVTLTLTTESTFLIGPLEWEIPAELRADLASALDGIRLSRFNIPALQCRSGLPVADLADIVKGFACPSLFAPVVPGPELPPDLVQAIVGRFRAEAKPDTEHRERFADSGVALVDSTGAILRLDATEDGTALLNPENGTIWVIPAGLRSDLQRYGVALVN